MLLVWKHIHIYSTTTVINLLIISKLISFADVRRVYLTIVVIPQGGILLYNIFFWLLWDEIRLWVKIIFIFTRKTHFMEWIFGAISLGTISSAWDPGKLDEIQSSNCIQFQADAIRSCSIWQASCAPTWIPRTLHSKLNSTNSSMFTTSYQHSRPENRGNMDSNNGDGGREYVSACGTESSSNARKRMSFLPQHMRREKQRCIAAA